MNKLKKEKGITLVALIITIVVLLILAAVAIGAVKNSDIIGYSKNAATDYETKQEEEKGLIEGYEMLLGEQQGMGPWKVQEDGTIKNGKTGETKKIGDTFTNDEVLAATGGTKSSYTGTWSVLGAENGRLKLVSTENVAEEVAIGPEDPELYVKDEQGNPTTTLRAEIVEIYDNTSFDLEKVLWSYKHAVETINTKVKKATGIESARSIKIEDIEAKEVLNITESQKRIYDSSYGDTYEYYYDEGGKMPGIATRYLEYGKEDKEENWVIAEQKTEVYVSTNTIINGESESNKNNREKLVSNIYYNKDALIGTEFADFLGNTNYWLASYCVYASYGMADFYIHAIYEGGIGTYGFLGTENNPYRYGAKTGVRAVVYI